MTDISAPRKGDGGGSLVCSASVEANGLVSLRNDASFLVFEVGGRICALPTPSVREAVHLPEIARPPGLPSTLEGFLDDGGVAVPVLRLDRLFGFAETEPGLYTPLLILRSEKSPLALLVDRLREVRILPKDQHAPIREDDCFNGCAEAEARSPDGVIHLLSPERILLERERRSLEALRVIEQERWEAISGGEA